MNKKQEETEIQTRNKTSNNIESKQKIDPKYSEGKMNNKELFIGINFNRLISDGFLVFFDPRDTTNKSFMKELAATKSMDGEEILLKIDDTATVMIFLLKKHKTENKFRVLYSCYNRVKNYFLSRKLDIKKILNYIASYFSILFISPDSLDIKTKKVVEKLVILGTLNLSSFQPNEIQNPQMVMVLNMMMSQNRGFQKFTKETFTNIQIEFYKAFFTEGIIIVDREFTEKIVEEWSSEMYELIIKKSYLSIDNLKDINTLRKW